MSLNHHFGLLSLGDCDGALSVAWKLDRRRVKDPSFPDVRSRMRDRVALHDDVLRYMARTLERIPSHNPYTGKEQTGLNLCGVTLITKDGAPTARSVFEGWAMLFSAGPEQLDLMLRHDAESSPGSAEEHPRLMFKRSLLVNCLRRLAQSCEKVAMADGTEFILHLGI